LHCTKSFGNARSHRRWLTIKLGAQTSGAVKADCEFSTSGTTITFAGYRQAYQEVEEDTESEEKEALLPPMKVGDSVQIDKYSANGHETSPPARYTEPTLVKKLEELGIGRPSTYAAILGTILNRGYVWKKGQAIVPSWTAFAVVKLMKNHFTELVDYTFTATVEEELDEIAQGLRVKEVWLGEFYYGNGKELPGLKPLVECISSWHSPDNWRRDCVASRKIWTIRAMRREHCISARDDDAR
jgi:DNA topoisomerase-1